jgi:hypothetical protein
MKKHLLGLAIVLAANTGHAHDEANCRDISNLLARLSCYDESHAGPSTAASAKISASGSASTDQNARQLPTFNAPAEPRRDATDSSFGKARQMFGSRDSQVVLASLVQVSKSVKRATRLYLDNDQIWQPTKDRAFVAAVGDTVRIKAGTIGGFVMSINDGSWFRVKRVD